VRADARHQAQQEKRIKELERRVREGEKPGTCAKKPGIAVRMIRFQLSA